MKKPSVKEFKTIIEKTGGHISNTAKALGVSRVSVYKWIKEDAKFEEVFKDSRGKMLDECISTARIVALGIPKKDAEGKFAGWEVAPDSYMLRYLIGTLGRNEGFGDSIEINTTIRREPRTLSPKEIKEYGLKLEETY